jgi:hypothetical protein
MRNWFEVRRRDDGNLTLVIPPHIQAEFDEEIKAHDLRGHGISLPAALLLLHSRVTALESIPRVTEVSTGGRATTGQAPKSNRRRGRADRLPFGWKLDPHDDKKLLPDKHEMETIQRAQFLRSFKLSLREVCRRLDQEGRKRRGKEWNGSHSILREILDRNKSV